MVIEDNYQLSKKNKADRGHVRWRNSAMIFGLVLLDHLCRAAKPSPKPVTAVLFS